MAAEMVAVGTLAATMVVGGTLLAAGITKVRDVDALKLAILNYGVFPGIGRIAARVLPAVEVLLGVALLVGFMVKLAAGLALVLFGVFLWVSARSLVRGRRIPCFCFGADDTETIGGVTILRLSGLIAATVYVLIMAGSDALLRTDPATLAIALLVALTTVQAFVIVTSIPTVIAALRTPPPRNLEYHNGRTRLRDASPDLHFRPS